MTTDEGQPEGEGGVEDGESESKSKNKTKPPRVDEYQWKRNIGDYGSRLVAPY